jgi:DNA replication protein DnaC
MILADDDYKETFNGWRAGQWPSGSKRKGGTMPGRPPPCPTCHGSRTFVSSSGTSQACQCDQQKALADLYEGAGVPEIYWHLDWDDFVSDQNAKLLGERFVRERKGYLGAGFGALFYGPNGTGKSMLTCLVMKELLCLGYDARFLTFNDLIHLHTEGWKVQEAAEDFERHRDCDLLVIDDVGKERPTNINLAETIFDTVFRYREGRRLSTFLTSNLRPAQLFQGTSIYGSVQSLLQSGTIAIGIKGRDQRGAVLAREMDRIAKGITHPIVGPPLYRVRYDGFSWGPDETWEYIHPNDAGDAPLDDDAMNRDDDEV